MVRFKHLIRLVVPCRPWASPTSSTLCSPYILLNFIDLLNISFGRVGNQTRDLSTLLSRLTTLFFSAYYVWNMIFPFVNIVCLFIFILDGSPYPFENPRHLQICKYIYLITIFNIMFFFIKCNFNNLFTDLLFLISFR